MQKSIYRIRFEVGNSPSNITTCTVCSKNLPKGEIRITIRRYMKQSEYFHLACYSCKFNQYISKKDLSILLKGEDLGIFNTWLDNWNKNYYPLDFSPIHYKIPGQSLSAIPTPNKRLYTEILKFLQVKDILTSITLINKEFYQVVWSKELWQSLLLRDFNYAEIVEDPKLKYSEKQSLACIECCKICSDSNFNRCPLLKKTLCKLCLRLPKYCILNLSDIKNIYYIDPEKLKLNFSTCDGYQKVTYTFLVKSAIEKFRSEQKEKVLKMMQILGDDHPAVKCIKEIDVNDMDTVSIGRNWKRMPTYVSKPNNHIKWEFYNKIFEYIRKGVGSLNEKKILTEVMKDKANIESTSKKDE